MSDSNDSQFIAPIAVAEGDVGQINHLYEDEDIDHTRGYMLPIARVELTENETLAVPLDFTTAPDADNGDSTTFATEVCERYAHILPCTPGTLGPSYGKYVVHTRVPTNWSGEIQHVSIPGDMGDQVAARIFDLLPILDIATSALSSIGGPILGGFLNTGRELISNLFGGTPSQPPQDLPAIQNSANPVEISGDIPAPRWQQFLKVVAENLLEDPQTATLLLKLVNVFTGATTRAPAVLPATVFLRLNGAEFDRQVINRQVTPLGQMSNRVYFAADTIPGIMRLFGLDRRTLEIGTRQNFYFNKFIMKTYLDREMFGRSKPIFLDDIRSMRYDSEFAQSLVNLMRARDFNHDGIKRLVTECDLRNKARLEQLNQKSLTVPNRGLEIDPVSAESQVDTDDENP